MKRLMIFAVAMTIVGGAYAQRTNCGEGPEGITSECSIPVWDFKAAGKTANTHAKKSYKAVQKVKFTGVIVGKLDEGYSCCLEGFDLYIYDKSDKALYKFEDNAVEKMTVFGKGLEKVLKPGKSAKVESDVLWTWAGDTDDGEILLQFVGFGKGKRYMSKDKPNTDPCGDNSIEGCEESFDWPSWKGWFTGWLLDDDEFYQIACDDPCVAVAGGTWSGKLNKKLSGGNDYDKVENAIESKFKTRVYED